MEILSNGRMCGLIIDVLPRNIKGLYKNLFDEICPDNNLTERNRYNR